MMGGGGDQESDYSGQITEQYTKMKIAVGLEEEREKSLLEQTGDMFAIPQADDDGDMEDREKGVADQMQDQLSKMKVAIGLEKQKEPDFYEESGLIELISLSREQRLYGFMICCGIGIFLSLLSLLFYTNAVKFAICYTLGNIVAIFSTGFLMGFFRQFQNMFRPHRMIATSIYFLMIALTLYAALVLHNVFLCLICVFLQSCALTWYCLSYIPYGRKVVRKCLGGLIGEDLEFLDGV